MTAIVFLGGGRITTALVAGLRGAEANQRGRERLVVHDRNPEKLRMLARRYGVRGEPSLRRAVERAGLLLVAVRPRDVLPLLAELGPLRPGVVCVCLAAGVTLGMLRRALGPGVALARAMPSPASRYGRGLTALAFGRGAARSARRRVWKLFSGVGAAVEIPERELDAFTVAYSTSQGYHALGARVRAARRLGLGERTAWLAAAHGLAEGVRAAAENPAALDALLAEAATPAGIAAETLRVMRAGGYQRLVERAYRAGVERARQAGRTGRRAAQARDAAR
ncbi:MAG TPA: NAD(P)-binding domain-containing protein [Candidatus Acidoferrales bacterium]|nr:NAD(P)-binding domain-containing protein [Candidatus Acidoferrales bacterium]